MSPYSLVKPLLFGMDAERSHDFVLKLMSTASRRPALLSLLRTMNHAPHSNPVEVMGLRFANRVGLAAGLDKDARCGPAFSALGFGFVELGTVTPQPQPGNARPRMFRLAKDRGIINRMGFNSGGLENFLKNFRAARPDCIAGINLGKNAVTPIDQALEDYRLGMQAAYLDADYLSINISSPNTRNLRELQGDDELTALLHGIADCRRELEDRFQKYTPIAVKIAPDLETADLARMAATCVESGMDAIIATNTTVARPQLLDRKLADETGGLSGAPLTQRSTEVVAALCRELGGQLPVIGVGGIMNGADARDKINAGAALVQLYSGLIYAGPKLIRESITATTT